MTNNYLQCDIKDVAPRARVEWSFASLLATILALVGIASLFAWQPISNVFAVWGLPRWTVYASGVIELAAAVFVLIESAAFYTSIAVSLFALAGIVFYLRVAPAPLVLIPGALFVIALCEAFARAHVVSEQFSRRRTIRVTT